MSASGRVIAEFRRTRRPMRFLGASGQLGYGIPTPAFNAGLERKPDLIGVTSLTALGTSSGMTTLRCRYSVRSRNLPDVLVFKISVVMIAESDVTWCLPSAVAGLVCMSSHLRQAQMIRN